MIGKNKKVTNIILVLLCIIAICINLFFEDYKPIGAACILFTGILSIAKDYKK